MPHAVRGQDRPPRKRGRAASLSAEGKTRRDANGRTERGDLNGRGKSLGIPPDRAVIAPLPRKNLQPRKK